MKSRDRSALSSILQQEGIRVASPAWKETSSGLTSKIQLISTYLIVSLDEIDVGRWGCTIKYGISDRETCAIAQHFDASREVALTKALQTALWVLDKSKQFLQDLQPDR